MMIVMNESTTKTNKKKKIKYFSLVFFLSKLRIPYSTFTSYLITSIAFRTDI